MYYYSTVIAAYCTVMQNCDTVQSSCDNDLWGPLRSPVFRWKGSQFLPTALSHLYVLLVALGNRTLNPTGTLSTDQGTRQITLLWSLPFEGIHVSFQHKLWHKKQDGVHLCLLPALSQNINKLPPQIKGVLSSPQCYHKVKSLNTFGLCLRIAW